MKNYFLFFATALLLSSCIVSKKKFDDMLAQKVRTEADLNDKTAALDSLSSNFSKLNQQFDQLKSDTSTLGSSLRTNQKKLAGLEAEHTQLNDLYKNLLNNSGRLNRDLTQQQQQLLSIQQNLDKTRRENDSLSTSLAEREKKVVELEQVLANKDKAVQELKSRITNALLNFKENDLTVKVKNGKVYVSLAEQLLFGSGSI
ncbi:MAG: hypothetical protein EBU52_22080, partial [Cytophagia bacterium]|nr:hypothetical protein [Cytophagia bacterium]